MMQELEKVITAKGFTVDEKERLLKLEAVIHGIYIEQLIRKSREEGFE